MEGSALRRQKPLLLLTYLALEGPKSRRFLSRLFWHDGAEPMNSLRVAISRMRRGAPDCIAEDGNLLRSLVPVDASLLLAELEAGEPERAVMRYQGAFLEGSDLLGIGVELEEWVYGTREFLAERVRHALLGLAEKDAAVNDFGLAGTRAEAALKVRGAPPLDPPALERLHRVLLAAGSPATRDLAREASDYGLVLDHDREAARARLAPETADLPAAPNNLPVPLSEFVGRDPERLELSRLLDDPTVRLVTLVGPGGVGKSRLALEVAHTEVRGGRFEGGAYFVSLGPLADPLLVPGEIASAIGLELSGRLEALAELTASLGDRKILLVLDNCEQLPGIAEIVGGLLQGCRGLRAIATSRDRIRLPGEQLFPVAGLSGADKGVDVDDADALHHDAVRLFVGRGRLVRPGFEPTTRDLAHVRTICRLVHGFPLGIELAATWLRIMAPDEIATEMERDLGFLDASAHGLPGRHSGLRAAFEHSWRLLTAEEQTVLTKLSVFAGGFTREAASAVAGATIPLLAALTDKSLLRPAERGRFYRHPLVRQYSNEKLAALPEEAANARAAHLAWFQRLAEQDGDRQDRGEQRAWLERLEREHDNLRAALGWALSDSSSQAQQALGVQLAVRLYRFWYYRSHLAEGLRWLLLATRCSDTLGKPALPLKSRALHAAGVLANEQGDHRGAAELFEARIALARECGDELGEAASLNSLGVIALERGEYRRARELVEQSLTLRQLSGDGELLFGPLLNLGLIALRQKEFERAQERFEGGLAMCRELGNDMGCAIALSNLGTLNVDLGRPEAAREQLAEAAELYRSLGNRDGLAHCLEGFAGLAVLQGRFESAARLAGAAAALRESLGIPQGAYDASRSEQGLAPARVRLGERAYQDAWRQGRGAVPEEALAEALAVTAAGRS